MSDHPAPSASQPPYPTPSAAPPPPYGYPAQPYAGPPAGPVGRPPLREPQAPRPGTLGTVALVLALAAAVLASVIAAVACVRVGEVGGAAILAGPASEFDFAYLAPARGSVLTAELSFWAGTVLGIWALVQGIVAIAQQRGRGQGIAAVVVAALGPVVFAVAVVIGLSAGASGPLAF
ncbi:hypothetical protein [Microbacterium sp. zg.Y909]|uniref:hypothetical protein n=1 Tax=Microbacterium sp. zg.Y909 TaxID=2969413 RepID=UPI00214BE051|nr:hypothetical protein [Microbacterium sp. zg.Y909]MCR2825557.1 hypothetical protein [Microbacterium sp. zg.Y909]